MPETFTLTPADFSRLQKVVTRRFRRKLGVLSWQRVYGFGVGLCVGLAGATFARPMRDFPELSDRLELVAWLLVVALLGLSAAPHVLRAANRKFMIAPNGAFLSPQTVSFSPEGLTTTSSCGNSFVPWSGVLARDEDDANYYLFVDAMQTIILPRSVVTSHSAEFELRTGHLKGVT